MAGSCQPYLGTSTRALFCKRPIRVCHIRAGGWRVDTGVCEVPRGDPALNYFDICIHFQDKVAPRCATGPVRLKNCREQNVCQARSAKNCEKINQHSKTKVCRSKGKDPNHDANAQQYTPVAASVFSVFLVVLSGAVVVSSAGLGRCCLGAGADNPSGCALSLRGTTFFQSSTLCHKREGLESHSLELGLLG